MGLLDEPTVLRLTSAPDAARDEELAHQLVADLTDPERGVLPAGRVAVEAPQGALVHDLLSADGWQLDEPWTPLQRDLAQPVEDPGVRIEVIGPEVAHIRTAVQRASFDRSAFTDERWHAMARGLPYADARCLVAYDGRGAAVAATTVWSAGPGRPGLLEPMGVHRDHRGAGYGRAICVAAAGALRELGSSSAQVCTLSANVGGVATYRSAGFQALPAEARPVPRCVAGPPVALRTKRGYDLKRSQAVAPPVLLAGTLYVPVLACEFASAARIAARYARAVRRRAVSGSIPAATASWTTANRRAPMSSACGRLGLDAGPPRPRDEFGRQRERRLVQAARRRRPRSGPSRRPSAAPTSR